MAAGWCEMNMKVGEMSDYSATDRIGFERTVWMMSEEKCGWNGLYNDFWLRNSHYMVQYAAKLWIKTASFHFQVQSPSIVVESYSQLEPAQIGDSWLSSYVWDILE